MSLTEYRKQLLNYINFPSWINPVAVTLTYKQVFHSISGSIGLTATLASQNIRHFFNKINRRYFKNAFKRYGKQLSAVPVMEISDDGRIHYHLLIDRPSHISLAQFDVDIRAIWRSTDWGYKEIHIDPNPNQGWLYYITKRSQKPEYDLSIDWMNYHKR
jgi:hypothetical protein